MAHRGGRLSFEVHKDSWCPDSSNFLKLAGSPSRWRRCCADGRTKEDWLKDDNYINGGLMRKALLDAGYSILALDAATHGERAHEIDFQHVNLFDDPKAPARCNYFTFAEIAIQTVKDYRRALDFMSERGEVDMSRVGLLGYSMGGMDAFYLLSVEIAHQNGRGLRTSAARCELRAGGAD